MECLFVEQFYRFKCGDRFWFAASSSSPYPFTEEQIKSLENHTLSSIFCVNTNVTKVPKNLLAVANELNEIIECNSLVGINLKLWKD